MLLILELREKSKPRRLEIGKLKDPRELETWILTVTRRVELARLAQCQLHFSPARGIRGTKGRAD